MKSALLSFGSMTLYIWRKAILPVKLASCLGAREFLSTNFHCRLLEQLSTSRLNSRKSASDINFLGKYKFSISAAHCLNNGSVQVVSHYNKFNEYSDI